MRKESALHPLTYGGRCWRLRLAIALGALALSLVYAAPSDAGTYIHKSCVTGGDLVDAYGGWQSSTYSMVGNANTDQCPWGGLHSQMNPAASIPIGAAVGWTYAAPHKPASDGS